VTIIVSNETYVFQGRDEFEEIFELAQAGKPFEVYSRARLKRVKYPASRVQPSRMWRAHGTATRPLRRRVPCQYLPVHPQRELDDAGNVRLAAQILQRPLFPEYFPQNYPEAPAKGRLASLYREIAFSPARQADLLGTFTAAWDDSGLHNEVFWLGWVAGSSWAWHRETPEPEEFTAQFMKLFYGPEAYGMTEVYRLTDAATQFWAASWDRVPAERGPSYKKYMNWDDTLALPTLPSAVNLSNHPFWRDRYQKLLAQTDLQMGASDRLIALLHDNLGRVRQNRYNLEVLLTQAKFMRHNLSLLRTLAQVEDVLTDARTEHSRLQYANAAERLEGAHQLVSAVVRQREAAYQELVATWEKSRYPKGHSAGGRQFVHILDDTKDHWADRTPDLSYLVMRERKLGLEDWLERLKRVRDEYMRVHKGNLRYAQDEK
jgi:hexosaminidase